MAQPTITTGFIANPYRQFKITIPPRQIHKENYVHNVFEVLENNQSGFLKVNFGGSGGFTEMEQGIVYKYEDNVAIPFVELMNESDNEMEVKIAMGVGVFNDQRLNVSGAVTVQSLPETPVYVADVQFENVTVDTITLDDTGAGTYTVPAGTKKVLIQNTGTQDVRVFSATGFVINPTGTMDFNYSGTIAFYGTAGETVTAGAFA